MSLIKLELFSPLATACHTDRVGEVEGIVQQLPNLKVKSIYRSIFFSNLIVNVIYIC
jgi:hypothetical protein